MSDLIIPPSSFISHVSASLLFLVRLSFDVENEVVMRLYCLEPGIELVWLRLLQSGKCAEYNL